ncbi:site-specific integrase [Fibrella sp. ES10-3-2-2]|nr:hypothetical protein A6C57_25650 [Fibrella sp. ES10-3-2-2]
MNKDIPSVKISYDKLRTGEYSIKLRVCLGTQRPRFHLPVKEGVIVSPGDYDKLIQYHQSQNKRRAGEDIRGLYDRILPFVDKAEKICHTLLPFTFAAFETQFYNQAAPLERGTTVSAILQQLEEDMDAQGRPGNADNFQSAHSSLKRFLAQLTPAEREQWLGMAKEPAPPLRFDQMTPLFLEAYERWMVKAGKMSQKKDGLPSPASLTSVGIYTRAFRTAFNLAIDKQIVTQKQYPFGKDGYVAPAGRNPKKALKKDVIRQIRNHTLEPGSMAERSRDLWVLSFFSNGLNFADLCQLRWSAINFTNETITVIRKKTGRTQRGNQIKIVATLFPESRQIIERWAGSGRASGDYVFPFLTPDMTPRQQRDQTRLIIKTTNKWMARIAEELGITDEVNTYAARHSFGTALLKSGADLNLIKNKFGHSSLKTTESYLSDFEDDEVKAMLRDSLM